MAIWSYRMHNVDFLVMHVQRQLKLIIYTLPLKFQTECNCASYMFANNQLF